MGLGLLRRPVRDGSVALAPPFAEKHRPVSQMPRHVTLYYAQRRQSALAGCRRDRNATQLRVRTKTATHLALAAKDTRQFDCPTPVVGSFARPPWPCGVAVFPNLSVAFHSSCFVVRRTGMRRDRGAISRTTPRGSPICRSSVPSYPIQRGSKGVRVIRMSLADILQQRQTS
jgi:hypothetical protein